MKTYIATALVVLGIVVYVGSVGGGGSQTSEVPALPITNSSERLGSDKSGDKNVPTKVAQPAGEIQAAISATKTVVGSIKPQNLRELKASYADLLDEELKNEIRSIEGEIEAADYINRSNRNELSADEAQYFSDRLQNLDALRLVKLERRLKRVKKLASSWRVNDLSAEPSNQELSYSLEE